MEPLACVLRAPLCPLWFKLFRSLVYSTALTPLACGRNDIPRAQVEVADSAGVRITTVIARPESLPAWTLEVEPRRVLTGAETGDDIAFAFVGPVRFLSGGGLVVGDVASSRLIIYDSDGRFRRFLGRRGDGPGEMRRLESVTVMPGDTVATFDPSLRRLSFWHAHSDFMRSVSLVDNTSLDSHLADAWPWRGRQAVVLQISATPQASVTVGSGVQRWPMRARLTVRDSNGVVLHTSPPFDAMYSGLDERGELRLPFSNRPFAAVARDRVYYGSGDAFEVSYLDTSFTTAGSLRWPARQERLTSAEVDSVRAEAIALISRRPLPPNPFAKYFAPEILPVNRPAIGRVFVDAENRLWIERFEAIRMGTAAQRPGNQWSIIREDGLPVAILQLPPHTRLEDVRGDDVVVVRRDSLDVQSVAVFRLRR